MGEQVAPRLCQVLHRLADDLDLKPLTLCDLVELFPLWLLPRSTHISTINHPQAGRIWEMCYFRRRSASFFKRKRIFNIAIRTLNAKVIKPYLHGVEELTWDGKWESEYQETKQKSAVLYKSRAFSLLKLSTTGRIHKGELTFWSNA